MFDILSSMTNASKQADAILNVLRSCHAVVEFSPDGVVLDANLAFQNIMGYSLSDIKNQHHKIFLEEDYAKSDAYKHFWKSLKQGLHQAAVFSRLAKGGRQVWLQAIYVPVEHKGQVQKIIKFATDITAEHNKGLDDRGKQMALDKAQSIIEFTLDGTIIRANENFLTTMGYSFAEIEGKKHSLFVDDATCQSSEYADFWRTLRSGQYHSAIYKRYAKGGREVWLRATYNPVFNDKGEPVKVVKFATDITQSQLLNADYQGKIDALNKAQAVIEFNLDSTIITANDNFLNAVGYTLEEIRGQHHSLFVDSDTKSSAAYKQFWDQLRHGEFQSGEYKRMNKRGEDLWLQATYNPILDPAGRPFKVVKFATDITEMVKDRLERERVANIVDQNLERIVEITSAVSENSGHAVKASAHTDTVVQAVAAAAEEMAASIQEIVKSITLARSAVDKTSSESEAADNSTKELSDAAEAMNQIVTLIDDIAEQINLLALNATIEAARAGDAGKGFAVVASEVKNLATQVAQATHKISEEIERMQTVSSDVVLRLGEINSSVGEVRSYVTGIASAAEQQSAATREISGNMQTAASSVADINHNLIQLSEDADQANLQAQESIQLYRTLKV